MNLKYTQFNPTPFEAHMLVYEKIRSGSKVLDVGCATGYFANKLKEKDCKVWGIEKDKDAAREAGKYCEEVVIRDIEELTNSSTIRGVMASHTQPATSEVSLPPLLFQKNFFDYILLLDVLEHLREPEKIIRLFKPYLKKDGKIIISVPNIAHVSIRLKLLMGKFDYEKVGIMDETHLRFFTQKTIEEFIKQAGMQIVELDHSVDFGQFPLIGRIARKLPKRLQHKITKLFPNLLAVQIIAVCSL